MGVSKAVRLSKLTGVLALLAVLTACASAGSAGSSAGGTTAGGTGSTSAAPSSASSPASPSGSPSGKAAIAVSGSVPASVLSLAGPFEPAGPYLGASIDSLLNQFRSGLGGNSPTCAKAGCWSDAQVPAGSLLVAVRPGLASCFRVRSIAVSGPAAGTVQLDLQLVGVCRVGVGSAARMPAILMALPSSALPKSGPLNVTVRVSANLGQPFQPIGTAHTVL